ncbi:MAG: thrombospondin type 3 repeat-containing protein [Myxococcales bacterium]|nr:thrombospondin type 3 repeat-containing protein [Myxococcales bacterium]
MRPRPEALLMLETSSRLRYVPFAIAALVIGCSADETAGDAPILAVDVVTDVSSGDVAGFDTGHDVTPDGGTGTPDVVATGPEPIPYQACSENADCPSGFCVESADGRTCTRECVEECPDAWRCANVSVGGADVAFICVPRFVTLCMPCLTDSDCADDGGLADARCLDYGAIGSYCGAACNADSPGAGADATTDCPEGYQCDAGQCRRLADAGECSCTWKAVKETATTSCEATSEIGTCRGERGCLTGTLTACDAPTPALESCNGVDDDCDGQTDDEIAEVACSETSEFGTCVGVTTCASGVPGCTAPEPTAEMCDGKDNDCDSLADEGFPDTDQNGIADCVSDDDDGDGVPDLADNCPATPNTQQEDLDGDDVGDVCDPDVDGDGDPNVTDCAPTDPAIGKNATELCNAKDDDCDLAVDEGFPDLDQDTLADCVDDDDDADQVPDTTDNCPVTANTSQTDSDGDGKGDACEDDLDGDADPDITDCAPNDPTIRHGATEACNGADENCNGIVDEGFPDTDADGVMNCLDLDDDGDDVADFEDVCPLDDDPEQLDTDTDGKGDACDTDDDQDGTPDVLDCGPTDPAVSPKATEICNSKDDDCDGVADEAGASGCTDYLYNGDGDSFGVGTSAQCLCAPKAPFTAVTGGDCNDQNGQVFPGASEVCNGQDDDCDELKDEGAAVGCTDGYVDGDKDGVGTGDVVCACSGTAGTAAIGGDCNDADASVKPGALELCNGKDDSCNGLTDEQGSLGCQAYYKDADQDGTGSSGEIRCLCAPDESASFTAATSGDCNDADAEVAPAHPEVCDLKDNNCNGQLDEGVQTTFFLDEDTDGFGASYSSKLACAAPNGFVAKAGDCNDFNGAIYPQAVEACNDVDDDCDGLTDDGLATQTIYKDNDGDGYAAQNAAKQQKCNIPVGWVLARDADGNGSSDWDCSDSDVTMLPGGATICGDGKDNNCDGIIDRLCFTACGGDWPFEPAFSTDAPSALVADLHGDGTHEVVTYHSFGFAILGADGQPLYDYSAPNYNYARNAPVLADIDDYASFGAGIQSLEVLTGNGSAPRFYKVGEDGAVSVFTNNEYLYDASRFLSRDIDYDGKPEFVSATWCEAAGSELYRFTAPSTISLVASVPSPDGACQYANGRVLTDLDGDGTPELAWGDGYSVPNAPSYWAGRIFARRFSDPQALAVSPYCSGESCFDTTVPGYFGGSVDQLIRLPEELRATATLFSSNTAGAQNQGATYTYRFRPDGTRIEATPGNTYWNGLSDVDDDGTPENFGFEAALTGLYDLNGDGYPDRLLASGKSLRVQLWNPTQKTYVTNAGSDFPVTASSLAIRAAWDLDGDGRIQILSADSAGSLYCHELGPDTWNLYSSLPPKITAAYRTWQWDNDEPNEGADTTGDGVPDQVVRLPSALTATGQFYGLISTATDEDFYMVDADWSGNICLRSPKGRNYGLRVYALLDRWNNTTKLAPADGKPDGLIWENAGTGVQKCFTASAVNPYRQGEFRFIVGIRSLDGTYSPHWPYFLHTPK